MIVQDLQAASLHLLYISGGGGFGELRVEGSRRAHEVAMVVTETAMIDI